MHHPDLSYTLVSDDARARELLDHGTSTQVISGINFPEISYLDLAVQVPVNEQFRGILQETLAGHDPKNAIDPLLWSSRSVFGRLGLHMEVDPSSIELGQSMLSVRLRIMGVGKSHGLNPEALLEKIQHEVQTDQAPRLGRLALLP